MPASPPTLPSNILLTVSIFSPSLIWSLYRVWLPPTTSSFSTPPFCSYPFLFLLLVSSVHTICYSILPTNASETAPGSFFSSLPPIVLIQTLRISAGLLTDLPAFSVNLFKSILPITYRTVVWRMQTTSTNLHIQASLNDSWSSFLFAWLPDSSLCSPGTTVL